MDIAHTKFNFMLGIILVAQFFLFGCSTEPESTGDATLEVDIEEQNVVVEQAPAKDMERAVEPERPALDLSMPDNIVIDDQENIEPLEGSRYEFDAGPLFEQAEQDDDLSIMVVPSFEPGDEPSQLPKLDGGSVSVEKKTK